MEIKKTKASVSVNLSGEKLAAGRKKSRLILGDDKFAVVAKKISENKSDKPLGIFKRHRYVRLTSSGGEVYDININSLAKRLHFTRAEVRNMMQDATWENKLNNRIQELTPLVNKYMEYFKKYGMNKRVLTKKTELKTSELLDLIKTSLPHFEEGASKEFSFKQQQWKLLPNKNGGGYKIFKLHRKLGQGGYAVVHKMTPLSNASKQLAHKEILEENADKGLKGIERELNVMAFIHNNQNRPGLTKRGGKIVGLPSKRRKAGSRGLLMPLALSMDVIERIPLDKKLKLVHELLQAGRNLEILQILHLDIKSENIHLFKEKGEYHVELADFGGSLFADPNTGKLNSNDIHYTPIGMNRKLLSPFMEADEPIDYKAQLSQIDLTSMGILFYTFLSESEWCPPLVTFDALGFPNVNQLNEELLRNNLTLKGVSAQHQEIIVKMIKGEEGYSFEKALMDFNK